MATEAADDRRLIARVAAGDEDALGALYTRYRPRLRHYLWPLLDGDVGQVDEALQDVFLAVWESAARFRGEAKVATWIFQIAHNIASQARQRRARRPALAPLLAVDQQGAASHRDGDTEGVVTRLAIHEALAQLSGKHREVLDLFFRQGFTSDETGAILGVPPGTVRSRLSYARKALRDALDQSSDPAWRRPARLSRPAEEG